MPTRVFGLEKLAFRLLQWLLLRVVRFKSVPGDAAALNLAPDQPVFYALHIRQLSALLVLDEAVRRLGLPSATGAFAGDTNFAGDTKLDPSQSHAERSKFFFLTRRGQPSPLQRNPYEYSSRLTRLVDLACGDGAFDVQIVPVSIFWGRAPDKQDSVIKALFADNWVTPGFFSQSLRLLLHGRQTLIKFGQPISLQSAVSENRESRMALRRVARLLRADFKRERELVIGPNLSHRQMLTNQVIASAAVRLSISAEAADKKVSADRVELRARKIAVEIASDYSYAVIRAFDGVLSRLWNRIYDGVEVHRFDEIPKVGAGAELIYLPCHRSHIDYLLLSYVIFHRGLQVPHVAAGENLNLPLVGGLLRRGGAFFLRRSFKGDALYGSVFSEYLHTIIARGFPIEYFVEGGRSRTGRTLPPKAGLLAMTVESWLRAPTRSIVFVPVYIGYERLFEGETYAAELAGKPKQRESVIGLLRSLRSLREQFGKVHVNVGEPIRIEDFAAAPGDQPAPASDEGNTKAMVARLSTRIVTRINAAVVINPINLIALALTGNSRAAIDRGLLAELIETYLQLLRLAPYSNRQEVTALSADEIIEYGKRQRVIEEVPHPMGNMIQAVGQHSVLLAYFRNNVLHSVVLISLIASLLSLNERMEHAQVHRIIATLYPFLRKELFLWRDPAELVAGVDEALGAMQRLGLLSIHDPWVIHPPAGTSRAVLGQRIAQVAQQPLERYYLVIGLLARFESGAWSRGTLEEAAFLLAQRIAFLHDARSPEFVDRASFRAIIDSLLEMQTITEQNDLLQTSAALTASAQDAAQLLPAETRLALTQVSERARETAQASVA